MPTKQRMYKYMLKISTATQVVKMPLTAKIMTLQLQEGNPCMWALVDPAEELVDRTFDTYGTGQQLPGGYQEYVGTYVLDEMEYVGHVFERK